MILDIILLVVEFIFLIKGADIFVDGASSTAQNFKVPKMLIGLTIVAFGTSAPEFAVSMSALANGNTDMVLLISKPYPYIVSCLFHIRYIIRLCPHHGMLPEDNRQHFHHRFLRHHP